MLVRGANLRRCIDTVHADIADLKAEILRVERDSDAALKLHSTDIRHVVDKVEEQIANEKMQADAKLHQFAQRIEQQDHRATQLVMTTEAALTNERSNTSESIGALKDALSYATQHTALQHEDVVQDRVDKYMHEELGKMRTGYLLDLEAKMDSAIAGLHMPTQSSGARRAASPARHG